MPALLALASALVFGAADFTGGYATRRSPVEVVTLINNVVGVVLAVGLVAGLGGSWTLDTVAWSAVGGACGLAGLLLLYLGLSVGPNRLVSPLSAVVAAVIPVVVGVLTGDRLGSLAVVGLVVTPVAIWLVAGGDHRDLGGAGRSVLLGLGAGAGFGAFFSCLAQTSDGAGAVPLLVARATSLAVLTFATVARPRRPPWPERSALGLPAMAGVLDMAANGLFLWSSRDGDLAVVGALVNLYPVTTVLLAAVVLAERMTRAQAAGLVLAVACAAMLG